MGFFVTYLRKNFVLDNNKEYNVVSAFEASGHLDKNFAEMEFKDDIRSIARWSPSPLQQWALKESKTFEVDQRFCVHIEKTLSNNCFIVHEKKKLSRVLE